ncbi:MAG: MFS transporter [Planctomycetes bacterium]|nr:MFS transporter [Planctomycetota bacterium]
MFATIGDKSKHSRGKHPLIVGCLLLGLAAVPDAMVVPVLHDLTVERFGVSEGSAHYFMAINLLGAVLAIGVLAFLKRRLSSSVLFISAAVLSAIFMALMALSTSWWLFLLFRCFEGGADLLLLSIPFRLIAGAGENERYAGRIGGGFTAMMVALAIGVGFGSAIGSESPESVLWTGTGIMAVLALIAAYVRRTVDNLPPSPLPDSQTCPLIPREWVGAGFYALDRGLAALVSTSLPILLASGFNITKMTLGVALVGMFLSLAVFSAPVGLLADRYGGAKIRLIASLMCGIALAGLGLMVWLPPVVLLVPCLLMYGVGASGLMPSAFSVAVRQDASNLVFGSLQAAGQAGYALGVLGGGLLITVVVLPPDLMIGRLFPIAGFLFIVCNCLLLFALRTMAKR